MLEIKKQEVLNINGLNIDAASVDILKNMLIEDKKFTLKSIVHILSSIAQTGIAKFEDGSERIDSDQIHILELFYDFIDSLPEQKQ